MKSKKRGGQILVLVLLVVVVVLAVGLSVASRNLTNLRTSTQAEQSQRAFTAAEGGVEDVLSRLNSVANVIQTNTDAGGCTRDLTDTDTANCTLPNTDTAIGGTVTVKASKGYERTVEPGDVAQLNLVKSDGTGYVGDIIVEWAKGSENAITLEYILVCQGGANCKGEPLVNGFGQYRQVSTKSPPAGQTGTFPACGAGGSGFTCRDVLNIPASNVKILRIKPFWNGTTVKVSASGVDLPVQTYEITSTATTDTGVSRKVEVKRDALPQLPGIFDYVLYSGGDIVK